VPYSQAQSTVGAPNFIRDLNRERFAFSVHDGDIKSGSTRCDDNVYAEAEAFVNALKSPAMYTPGDNEWTDCDRASDGGYLSSERLQYIRSTMFDTPYSFGRRRVRLEVQAERAGSSTMSPTPRSMSSAPTTTSATSTPTRPSGPLATRPRTSGCGRRSTRPKPSARTA
jgi:hypothetical protein